MLRFLFKAFNEKAAYVRIICLPTYASFYYFHHTLRFNYFAMLPIGKRQLTCDTKV